MLGFVDRVRLEDRGTLLVGERTAASNNPAVMPRPRARLSTKKQTIDHTGRSSTGFITGERRSFSYSWRGDSDIHPTGEPSS